MQAIEILLNFLILVLNKTFTSTHEKLFFGDIFSLFVNYFVSFNPMKLKLCTLLLI